MVTSAISKILPGLSARFTQNAVIKSASESGGTRPLSAFGAVGAASLFRLNPEVRLMTSTFPSAREFAERMLNNTLFQEKNATAGGTSVQGVETRFVRSRDLAIGQQGEALIDSYAAYSQRVSGKNDPDSIEIISRNREIMERNGINTFFSSNRTRLTRQEFSEEVAKAMRRLDVSENPSRIPEVNELSRKLRKELFEPILDVQIREGLIDPGVARDKNFTRSYVTQLFEPEDVRNRLDEFTALVKKQFEENRLTEISNLRGKLQELKSKASKRSSISKSSQSRIKNLEGEISELEKANDLESAIDYVDDLVSSSGGVARREFDDIPEKARFQRARKLIISKNNLEAFEEFMVNDISRITSGYIQNVLPRILLKQEFGSVTLKELRREINDQANKMIFTSNLSIPEKKALLREKDEIDQIILASRDRLLGIYKLPDDPNKPFHRISRALLRLNLLTKLGKVVVSNIPDVGRLIARMGLTRTFGNISKLALNPELRKLSFGELRRTVGIYETILNTRLLEQADLLRNNSPLNKLERGLEKLNERFGQISLMSPWNQMIRQVAAFNANDMFLETAEKFVRDGEGALSRSDILILNQNGITFKDLVEINKQFQRHGIFQRGVRIAQTSKWTNKALAEKFSTAIRSEIDKTIFVPGILSRPLWTSTVLGKHIAQFRGFSFTATNAIMISGLQQRDMAMMNSLMISIALGSLVFAINETLKGNEINATPRQLFGEGLDRSGVLGILSDASLIVERASRGSLGITPLVGGTQSSRQRSRDIVNAIGGVSVGTIQDFGSFIGAGLEGLTGGQITRADISATRRLIPLQNTLWFMHALNAIEEKIAEALVTNNGFEF